MECAPRCSAHHQRKNYFKFRVWSDHVCVAMKAPVGLLSGRAVCVSRWRGFVPTSSAERSKRIFTGGVVKASGICSAAFCESAALGAGARSPERADFPRPGEDVTAGDKKGNLSRSD